MRSDQKGVLHRLKDFGRAVAQGGADAMNAEVANARGMLLWTVS